MLKQAGVRAHVESRRLMVPASSRVVLPVGEAAIAVARVRERLWRKAAVVREPKSAPGCWKKHGGGKPQVIPEAQEGLLVTLRAHRWSYTQIGKLFGCSENAVISAEGRAGRRAVDKEGRIG